MKLAFLAIIGAAQHNAERTKRERVRGKAVILINARPADSIGGMPLDLSVWWRYLFRALKYYFIFYFWRIKDGGWGGGDVLLHLSSSVEAKKKNPPEPRRHNTHKMSGIVCVCVVRSAPVRANDVFLSIWCVAVWNWNKIICNQRREKNKKLSIVFSLFPVRPSPPIYESVVRNTNRTFLFI